MTNKNIIWFIYDGNCPICSMAAQALRIKSSVGELQILNARENSTHQIMQEINARRLNLDEGMVIKYHNKFYHGKNALHLMSMIGSNIGWFNRINSVIFRSKILCAIFYPPMRGVRNLLLKIKSISPIKNLEDQQSNSVSLFENLFSKREETMPDILKKRYGNIARTDKMIKVEGKIDVGVFGLLNILAPFLRIFSPMPLCNAKQVPITVCFITKQNSDDYFIDRAFYFDAKSPFYFRSRLNIENRDGRVIEYISSIIACRFKYSYRNKKLMMDHIGYVIKIFGIVIPLPVTLLVGRIYAEETAASKNSFSMKMNITHFLFGKLYEYKGIFSLEK